MSSLQFSVIIPVYGKWELTRNCLRSLREHTVGEDFEVIVVDNGSKDATTTELCPLGEALFGSRFTAIRNAENANFAPACNQGAHASTGHLLFFLNNDTLLTKNWAAPLVRAFRDDDKLGAAGPLLLYKNDLVQHLGVTVDTGGVLHLYRYFPKDHPVAHKQRHLQALTAAALMMPRALFSELGGFYEEYRNGFEDVDLSVRIRRKGFYLQCVSTSCVYHLESQTPGRKDNEVHNSSVLMRRIGKDIFVDYHHHALSDGFAVCFDPGLSLCALLTDKEDQTLRHSAQGQPLQELLRLTLSNPLWIWGHEQLAEILTREKKHTEALYFVEKLVMIYPTPERYRHLLQAAARAGNADMLETTASRLKRMLAFVHDKKKMAFALNSIMEKADRFNDKTLYAMCLEKKRELDSLP